MRIRLHRGGKTVAFIESEGWASWLVVAFLIAVFIGLPVLACIWLVTHI